jgi:hypothetical protein
MSRDALIREAAKAIRRYLPQMVGNSAAEMDRRLAELLSKSGEESTEEILNLFLMHDNTRHWFTSFCKVLVPPQVISAGSGEKTKTGGPPPGRGEALAARRLACPSGDYVWYQQQVGEAVPRCPTHGEKLNFELWSDVDSG